MIDVIRRNIDFQFVLEEGEVLPQRDVVPFEFIGFDDTVGCGISVREIGLCHFCTSAQCDGVVEVGSYPVEVADVVSIAGEVIGGVCGVVIFVTESVHALSPAIRVHGESVFDRPGHLCSISVL